MLGQISAQMKSVCSRLEQTANALNKQTEIIHENQLEMGRYWAGLENANKDIQSVRGTQRTLVDTQNIIIQRLDNAVPLDRFEKLENHVKTLNGTDSKFRMLGIDINDPNSVEEWRGVLNGARSRSRTASGVRSTVLKGLALAIAMAIGAAAWNGVKDGILSDRTARQEHTK